MRDVLDDFALRATAKKGNHPVLWIAFGILASVNLVTSIWDGRAMVPDPGKYLWGHGMREVSLGSAPFSFVAWVVTMAIMAVSCVSIGFIAISARARRQKRRHPLADLVNK